MTDSSPFAASEPVGANSGTGSRPIAGRLRIILRSHGGENMKSRPTYYSKLLCLASVIRAAEESDADPQLIFWNDGPMPAERYDLMRSSGEVVRIDVGSNRASYRAAIDMTARSPWGPNDLVWFAEDDYIYLPDSFRRLNQAWARLWDADYVSIYGGSALDLTSPRTGPRALPQLGAGDTPHSIRVGDTSWFRGVSTTSTFGVRHSVLNQDRRLLRMLPFSGGSWDHTTCLTVQGLQPFTWSEVGGELLPFGSMPAARWPNSIARGALRAGVNLRSIRTSSRQRRLYLSDPVAAMHLEVPMLGGGDEVAWAQRAEETRVWADSRGIRTTSVEASR